jgi:hypothetical protein
MPDSPLVNVVRPSTTGSLAPVPAPKAAKAWISLPNDRPPMK